MGRAWLEHPGGAVVYSCAKCSTPISNTEHIEAKSFRGESGPAFLFNKVVNVTQGEMRRSRLMTGMHYVRDVQCKRCRHRLGWFYEMAKMSDQRYKEGMTVLECAMLVEEQQKASLAQDALARRLPPASQAS